LRAAAGSVGEGVIVRSEVSSRQVLSSFGKTARCPKSSTHSRLSHNNARRRRLRRPGRSPSASTPFADMDPEAMRRACVAFRVKLSRDTGTNLDASEVAQFLDKDIHPEGKSRGNVVVNDPAAPPPRVCTSIHPVGWSCSSIDSGACCQ